MIRNLLQLLLALLLMTTSAQAQTTGSFTFDGQQRSFLTYLPSGFSSTDTLPLVISMHGLVMTAQSMWTLGDFGAIADSERFVVVCPNGVNNSWNTFGDPYFSGVDDVGFIDALIDTIRAQHHINLSRVYATGMSNGGYMS